MHSLLTVFLQNKFFGTFFEIVKGFCSAFNISPFKRLWDDVGYNLRFVRYFICPSKLLSDSLDARTGQLLFLR